MNVDRIAGSYALIERMVYRGALQRARCCYLNEIDAPARVLIIGEGDGRFLEALLARFPDCGVDVVEPSGRMIALAQKRIGESGAVKFHQCDFESFSGVDYDLVATHFFFDCFDESGQQRAAEKVVRLLGRGGVCLLSDFQMPKKGVFARMRARLLLKVMYRFFGITSGLKTRVLVDSQIALNAMGMRLQARQEMNCGFLRADRWGVEP